MDDTSAPDENEAPLVIGERGTAPTISSRVIQDGSGLDASVDCPVTEAVTSSYAKATQNSLDEVGQRGTAESVGCVTAESTIEQSAITEQEQGVVAEQEQDVVTEQEQDVVTEQEQDVVTEQEQDVTGKLELLVENSVESRTEEAYVEPSEVVATGIVVGEVASVEQLEHANKQQHAVESSNNPPLNQANSLEKDVGCVNESQNDEIAETVNTSRSLTQDELEAITDLEGNKTCVDCGSPNPLWASVSFGALLCLTCCGSHRSMGVHISFVRSLTLDLWKSQEIACMNVGGNKRLQDFFESKNLGSKGHARYRTAAAALYRLRLQAIAQNDEPPESLDSHQEFATEALNSPHSSSTAAAQHPNGISHQQQTSATTVPTWEPNTSTNSCRICGQSFTVVFRRHHCRSCGRVVCGLCAPAKNSKPLVSYGMNNPVRHCKECYRSPLINWTELESTAARKFPISFTLPKFPGST